MNLLVDTNIILVVLQKREPYYRDSATVWKLCEINRATGFVTTLTLANLVYVMRRELTPAMIREVLTQLSLIFEFADFTGTDLNKAAILEWEDFEDAIQNVIVTRNVRDFNSSKITALTPTELITKL